MRNASISIRSAYSSPAIQPVPSSLRSPRWSSPIQTMRAALELSQACRASPCPYDPTSLNFEGPFADFMRTVIWSYIGTRDPRDARVRQISVTPHVTAAYPPTFISVGNADPLAPQSLALAKALREQGVEVDALFFRDNHDPPLDHEYQLLLTTDAGRLALERSVAFLTARSK
jgi:acetyl esterase/lipase